MTLARSVIDKTESQRHILVVDDDDDTRSLLKELCESTGFRVTTAVDGTVALECMQNERPDIVLLDLMMPGRDGFSVLKTVRETPEWVDVPVILLTAMGDMAGKIRGMELGADDYITKPFKLIELQTRISASLMVRDYRRRLMTAEDELSQLRAVDPVTGAGTYAQAKASLDAEYSRARRYSRPLTVLLVGFDDYPGLRVELGRETCDGLVAALVRDLKLALRAADCLFRLDGGEFVVVLPDTDRPGARITADRLARVVSAINAVGRSGPVDLTIRFGVASYPSETVKSGEDLLREANTSLRALQRSKSGPRVFSL